MSSRQFKGQFRSPVGSLMEQFVQQKQACGYRYGEQAHLLARFDRFLCDEALSQCELPRSISRKWLAKQRHGVHSLRHTLATQLLREQTPFHVISEILGHATTASTLIYAKTDVEALRTAALNTEEVRHVE